MKKNGRFVMLVLGLFSGYLSFLLLRVGADWLPGFLFGFMISCCVIFTTPMRSRTLIIKLIIFVAISTFAYFVAFFTAIFLVNIYSGFFLSGAIGAFILSYGFMLLQFQKIYWRQILFLILLGGFLGFAGYYVGDIFSGSGPISLNASSSLSTLNLATLFVLWQGGMAYALGRSRDGNDGNGNQLEVMTLSSGEEMPATE